MIANLVEPSVLGRHPYRGGVDVGGQHRAMQGLRRSDAEHAGAGAEIEQALRTGTLQDMVKQQ